MKATYDAIVIGTGPAGEVAVGHLAEAGLETLAVERALVGGECAFWACMPSKALLRPAQALAEVRRVPGAAEAVTGALDVEAVLRRRDEVIHHLSDEVQLPWLDELGVDLVRGHGRIVGERTVQVGDDVFTARRVVVVAVGSRAAVPPIPGLAESEPWTSHEVTVASAIPERLIVLGGGVVACEMAQAYATLGSEVVLIHRGDRLLARNEPFVGDEVADGLRSSGVELRLRTQVERVERLGDGSVRVTLADDGGTVEGTQIVVALGRTPATRDLGLDTIGLEPGKTIDVTDHLQAVGHDWLYAVGDANGRSLLTHMGKHQARVAVHHILGDTVDGVADGVLAPDVVFTEPQVGSVGHTEASAREAGIRVRTASVGTSKNAGGSFYGRGAPGTSFLVIDEERDVIVGATITGAEVADMLHAATIAVVGEVPLSRLSYAVPSFPTRSEIWLRLIDGY